MGRPAQFNNGQPLPAKYGGQPPQPQQAPVGYTYEAFQTPALAAKPPSMPTNSKSVSMASSPAATPRSRDYVTDADTTMEDADPYNRAKYSAARPSHHSRPSSQYFPHEESSAARRYSPMNVLSPTTPYNSSPGKGSNTYVHPPNANQPRRSPTRMPNYSSPPQSYQSPPCELLPSRSHAVPRAFLSWIILGN